MKTILKQKKNIDLIKFQLDRSNGCNELTIEFIVFKSEGGGGREYNLIYKHERLHNLDKI